LMFGFEQQEQDIEFIDKPAGDNWTVKIPEPNSGNSGPTGLKAVDQTVRSQQKFKVTVEQSGDYSDYNDDDDSRFLVTPYYLKDSDGNDVVDDLNNMGNSGKDDPTLTQALNCLSMPSNSNFRITSIKMCSLERWKNYGAAYGFSGAMAFVAKHTVTNYVYFYLYRLREYDDLSGVCFIWDGPNAESLGATISNDPSIDIVEMEDGSLVAAISLDTSIYIMKSFDCGANWENVAAITGLSSDQYWVALERLGQRLVLLYARNYHDGANWRTPVKAAVSDDGGLEWSSAVTVSNSVTSSNPANMDCYVGQDGKLYAFFLANGDVYSTYSSDGESWSTPTSIITTSSYTDVAFFQEYHGLWNCYLPDSAYTGNAISQFQRNDYKHPAGSGWTNKGLLNSNAGDSDGMGVAAIAAMPFNNDGFVDVAVVYHDSHSTDYWSVIVYRTGVWSGIKIDDGSGFMAVWTPHAYPSTSDGHPNLNVWTKYTTGAGATLSFDSEGNFMSLKMTTAAAADGALYSWSAAGEWYDLGVTARFELKVESGYAKVNIQATSSGNNADVRVTVVFDQANNQIIIRDENAGSNATTYSPTNWDVADWNEYVIIQKGNSIVVYRAPSGTYREFSHFEKMIYYKGLQVDAYGSDVDRIAWGTWQAGYGGVAAASTVYWRSFYASNSTLFSTSWDFTTGYLNGRKCHYNPIGVMQGIGVQWSGDFAVEDDYWDVESVAQHDAENVVLRASPRVGWREKDVSGSRTSNYDIEFRTHEGDGSTSLRFVFNAIALFRTNVPAFYLYGTDWSGSSYDNLKAFSTEAMFFGLAGLKVTSVDGNYMVVEPNNAGNYDTAMRPNQFASAVGKKYYIAFTSGSLNSRIFSIVGNTENAFMLDSNVESLGVSAGDTMIVLSDRRVVLLGQMYSYPRIRLRLVTSGYQPPPDEERFFLGTAVLGMAYEINDEWGSEMVFEPGVSVVTGRGGYRQVAESGPERRIVRLTYSGLVDRGMGSNEVRDLLRRARWGVNPVVWMDYDSPPYDVCDNPVLAFVRNGITMQHKSYVYQSENSVNYVRSIHDVSGVVLEEVL